MSTSTTTNHESDPGMSTGMRRAVASAAAVVVSGVTLTAVATPADAAQYWDKVWNRVAACESGGDWQIDTGNGFYGGVQFSASTWSAYGGQKYASQAGEATRDEQVTVARRVLAAQGPNAWPVCGPNAGLTKDNGGATSKRLPDSARSVKHTTHKAKHRSTKPAAATSNSAHKAKHSAAGHTYTVHSGDTLSSIASKHHVHGGWRALYTANRKTLHNPNVLRAGQKLALPKA